MAEYVERGVKAGGVASRNTTVHFRGGKICVLVLSLPLSVHGLPNECPRSSVPDFPDLHAVTFMAELEVSRD